MEEIFFFMYHMKVDRDKCMSYTINERKWLIERFLLQKEKENEAMERARAKPKR